MELLNCIARDLFGKDYKELKNPQEIKIVIRAVLFIDELANEIK